MMYERVSNCITMYNGQLGGSLFESYFHPQNT